VWLENGDSDSKNIMKYGVQTCNKHFILSPGVIIPVVKTPATKPALNICRLLTNSGNVFFEVSML
jgi:hypothetical protein